MRPEEGLRHVVRDTLDTLAASGNRFVLTSRYVARAHRALRDAGARFEVIHLPALSAVEVTAMLPPMGAVSAADREFLGRTVQALTDGRVSIRPGNLYRVLHRLAEQDLVTERSTSTADERRRYFRATARGRRLAAEQLAMYSELLRRVPPLREAVAHD